MARIKRVGGALAALCCTTVIGFEGMQLVAYRDVVGVATVCGGETKGVKMGDAYTLEQCKAMLIERLDEFAGAVERCVPSLREAPPKRYVAHVSLAYNIGQSAYCKSSVARLQNAGDPIGACDAFLKWNKAGGVVWRGLTRRRTEERAMCREGV